MTPSTTMSYAAVAGGGKLGGNDDVEDDFLARREVVWNACGRDLRAAPPPPGPDLSPHDLAAESPSLARDTTGPLFTTRSQSVKMCACATVADRRSGTIVPRVVRRGGRPGGASRREDSATLCSAKRVLARSVAQRVVRQFVERVTVSCSLRCSRRRSSRSSQRNDLHGVKPASAARHGSPAAKNVPGGFLFAHPESRQRLDPCSTQGPRKMARPRGSSTRWIPRSGRHTTGDDEVRPCRRTLSKLLDANGGTDPGGDESGPTAEDQLIVRREAKGGGASFRSRGQSKLIGRQSAQKLRTPSTFLPRNRGRGRRGAARAIGRRRRNGAGSWSSASRCPAERKIDRGCDVLFSFRAFDRAGRALDARDVAVLPGSELALSHRAD